MKRWFVFAALAAWLILNPLASHAVQNLLENGDFEAGVVDPWVTYGDVTISISTDEVAIGKYSLYVEVNSVGANFWDIGLQHPGHVFQPGTYTLAAWLKGEAEREINFKPELAQDPWTGYGEQSFTMTTEWREYHTTAQIDAVVDPAQITFHIAHSDVNFWIDHVQWYEGEYVPSEVPSAVHPSGKLATTWATVKSR